mmetsp:Transcript_7839/g.8678  ORF Transcript_7839/g.8678 Transcript_7839/m.8678 type:complete len:361 (-) Transcript_7839:156-1238(-)
MTTTTVITKKIHYLLSVILLLLSHRTIINAQICDTPQINTWKNLTDQIDLNDGFVMLCPFTIKGSACPSSPYVVKANHHVELMCEPSYDARDPCGNSSCVIDCPSTHFVVEEHASLTLDGVKLSGSENTAVRVKENGYLVTYCTQFENNRNKYNNGGAIFAHHDSRVRLIDTHFERNEGQNGGAIFHQGIIYLDGSNFEDNKANAGGGAMYTGQDGRSTMIMNTFAFNHAGLFGPAVFDAGMNVSQQRNLGCQNTGNGINCDGVSALVKGRVLCDTFVEREAWCQTRISLRNAQRNSEQQQQQHNNNGYSNDTGNSSNNNGSNNDRNGGNSGSNNSNKNNNSGAGNKNNNYKRHLLRETS